MGPKKTTFVDLTLETEPIETQDIVAEGTLAAVKDLVGQLEELKAQTVDLTRYTEKFDGQLLYLRLSMGRLRQAISDAAAPIGAVLLPVVNRAIQGLANMADQVGLVIAALMDTLTGYDGAAQGADKAAKAQTRYGSAVRRSLAGFDQLQRLNGGGSGSTQALPQREIATLTPQLQAVVEKILGLIKPLREIDFAPLQNALKDLGECWSAVWQMIGGSLEWLWQEVLTPFVTWVAENLAPTLATTLAGALELMSEALQPVFAGLQLLWEKLRPVTEFISQTVIGALGNLRSSFVELSQVMSEKSETITGIFQNIGTLLGGLWNLVSPVLQQLKGAFSETFDSISRVTAGITGVLVENLGAVLEFLTGVFTGDWQQAWSGLKQILKGAVNGIIGVLNSMLAGAVAALNGLIRAANSIRFTMPKWVPGIGGESYGLNIKTVSAPQIPYLAKGAVLPANKPFLAVVGDQRSGTNVEAPLATIEQAVAQVTAGQNSQMLAAMQASVGVQQEILSAVLGIHIGDDTIAQAAERYYRKMAVVYGSGGR